MDTDRATELEENNLANDALHFTRNANVLFTPLQPTFARAPHVAATRASRKVPTSFHAGGTYCPVGKLGGFLDSFQNGVQSSVYIVHLWGCRGRR